MTPRKTPSSPTAEAGHIPCWAWAGRVQGSIYQQVNRRYHWKRGQLLALRNQARDTLRPWPSGAQFEAVNAIEGAITALDIEFREWKYDNGYA